MSNDERDEETGQYTGKYPDDAILDAVRDAAADSPLGFARTADVAERVGAEHSTAHRRLQSLHDAGQVERIDVSPAVGWRLTDDGDGQ